MQQMIRLPDNTSLKDRIPTKDLLQKADMLSVNQLAACIKITEAWKMCNLEDYPLKLDKNYENLIPTGRSVRPDTTREWNEDGKNITA